MHIKSSISTDFETEEGFPERELGLIAESGFTHILWNHHSGGNDHIYSLQEVVKIRKKLQHLNLALLDVHAPKGKDWNWISLDRDFQKLGLEMLKNRIEMASELGANSVMVHLYAELMEQDISKYWDSTKRALDLLEKICLANNVKLALENLDKEINNFENIKTLLKENSPQYLGLCYDSGHGNIQKTGLADLFEVKDRLVAVHLNDNHGLNLEHWDRGDEHLLPFDGTVDWEQLSRIIVDSAYQGPLSFEVVMQPYPFLDTKSFLTEAYKRAVKVSEMVSVKKDA